MKSQVRGTTMPVLEIGLEPNDRIVSRRDFSALWVPESSAATAFCCSGWPVPALVAVAMFGGNR